MSIHDAIGGAIRLVLSNYLAPNLVEEVSQEIIDRAQADMELAAREFFGFDLGGHGRKAKAKPATKSTSQASAAKKDKPTKTPDRIHAVESHDPAMSAGGL